MRFKFPGKVLSAGKTARGGNFINGRIEIIDQPACGLLQTDAPDAVINRFAKVFMKQTVKMILGIMRYGGQFIKTQLFGIMIPDIACRSFEVRLIFLVGNHRMICTHTVFNRY